MNKSVYSPTANTDFQYTIAVNAEVTSSQLRARLCGVLLHCLCPWCWIRGRSNSLPMVFQYAYHSNRHAVHKAVVVVVGIYSLSKDCGAKWAVTLIHYCSFQFSISTFQCSPWHWLYTPASLPWKKKHLNQSQWSSPQWSILKKMISFI